MTNKSGAAKIRKNTLSKPTAPTDSVEVTGPIEAGDENHFAVKPEFFLSLFDMSSTFYKASLNYLEKPDAVIQATHKLMRDTFELWQSAYKAIDDNREKLSSVIQPEANDRRFRDPLWDNNPTFDFLKQAYLLYSRWVEGLADSIPNITKDDQRKARFYSRQVVDALAPTNFAWANPTVVMRAFETKGDNLLKGYQRFLDDIKRGMDLLSIANTDRTAFEVGRDVAVTPGKVIFQNEIMQLIQYEPKTDLVYKTPILITPAWVNKYYILDLRPGHSFVEWLVEQGHTVFIISWINPGSNHKDLTAEDYLAMGPLEAIKVVKEIANTTDLHLIGYCLGGVLLSVLMGYLQEQAKQTIKSLTLLASPLDFSKVGDLLLFTDHHFYNLLCQKTEEKGLVDGSFMAATFNMLRANDMIWSAFINNYLLAEDPPQFDMLYWNSDVTNFPLKMFKTYVEELFHKNKLIKKNEMRILNKGVDIAKAEVPVFLLATRDDHIVPWKSMYAGIKILSGPAKFVLSGSGHIAGVVNPPVKNKYGYWENDNFLEKPEDWLYSAHYTPGSWWDAWQKWCESIEQNKKIDAKLRIPGKSAYKIIENAPGTYVKVTSEEALRSGE